MTIRAMELVTKDEAYFLESAVELGSAPCWRSKFVGDELRKALDAGTLSFPALATALGHVKDPALTPPITGKHTVYASLLLAWEAEGANAELASTLRTLSAQVAQAPKDAVAVELQAQVSDSFLQAKVAQALLQVERALLQRARGAKEVVADVSVSGVEAARAQAVTQAFVMSIEEGSVKAALSDRGISVKDSLVVAKPTCTKKALQEAKAALEARLKAAEKQLQEAKDAKEASEDLLNADADAHATSIEALETEVKDLKAKVASSPEECDAEAVAVPSLATTPEPQTQPTAKPPPSGAKVVEEVDLPKSDAGENPEAEDPLYTHISGAFMIAVSFIGIAICFFLASVRLMS